MRLNDSAMLTEIAGYLPIDNVTALDLCSGGVGVTGHQHRKFTWEQICVGDRFSSHRFRPY